MPRPTSPVFTYRELRSLLGEPVRERADFVRLDSAASYAAPCPPRKVHRGWSWTCCCIAFARGERDDAYLLVPCGRHAAAGKPLSARSARGASTHAEALNGPAPRTP